MTNVRPDNGCAPEFGLLYVLTVPILLIKYTAIIETPFGDFKNPLMFLLRTGPIPAISS